MDLKQIKEMIEANNIDTLRLEYPDLHGICRQKLMPVKHLETVAEEGLGFAQAVYAINLFNDVALETGCGHVDPLMWMNVFSQTADVRRVAGNATCGELHS